MIYDEGLIEGLWQKIDWLEAVKTERKSNENLETFIYRFLNERSTDPADGVFSNALIKNALSSLRAQIVVTGELPPLGNLAEICPGLP